MEQKIWAFSLIDFLASRLQSCTNLCTEEFLPSMSSSIFPLPSLFILNFNLPLFFFGKTSCNCDIIVVKNLFRETWNQILYRICFRHRLKAFRVYMSIQCSIIVSLVRNRCCEVFIDSRLASWFLPFLRRRRSFHHSSIFRNLNSQSRSSYYHIIDLATCFLNICKNKMHCFAVVFNFLEVDKDFF